MSLVINRGPGESFVIIDANDPESFVLVTVNGRKVEIDATRNVHIIRREILDSYPQHKDVLATLERMESSRDEKQTVR